MSRRADSNPYSPFLPVSDSGMFFGFKNEMSDIIFGLGLNKSVSFAIIGGRRIGKTSFLLELKRQMLRNIPRNLLWLPVYINLQEFVPRTPRQFFGFLAKKIFESAEVVLEYDESDEHKISEERGEITAFPDFTQSLVALLEDLRQNHGFVRFVLLIDEIGVIAKREWISDVSENLRFLLSNHPIRHSLSFVISAPIQLYRLLDEKGSPLSNILSTVFLRVFSNTEAKALITEPSTRLSLRNGVVDEIINCTGGHPQLTQYVMWRICQRPGRIKVSKRDVRRITNEYLEKQCEQFWYWLKYLDNNEKKVLALLLRADGSLHEKDISSKFPGIDAHGSLRVLRFMGIVAKKEEGYNISGKIMQTGLHRLVHLEASYYPIHTYRTFLKSLTVPVGSKAFNLIHQLNSCPKGKEGCLEFERICKDILSFLLVPPLGAPREQCRTETGLHIRDLIYDIPYDASGFWQYIRARFDASSLIVECKNYSTPIRGNQVVISSKYFGRKRLGMFGIIVSRLHPSESAKKEIERLWIEDGKLSLCFSDDDLVRMLKLKENGVEPEIEIDNAIHDFLRSLE